MARTTIFSLLLLMGLLGGCSSLCADTLKDLQAVLKSAKKQARLLKNLASSDNQQAVEAAARAQRKVSMLLQAVADEKRRIHKAARGLDDDETGRRGAGLRITIPGPGVFGDSDYANMSLKALLEELERMNFNSESEADHRKINLLAMTVQAKVENLKIDALKKKIDGADEDAVANALGEYDEIAGEITGPMKALQSDGRGLTVATIAGLITTASQLTDAAERLCRVVAVIADEQADDGGYTGGDDDDEPTREETLAQWVYRKL